ncbi:MAG: hypothetical protein AAGB16_00525 [Pseudomonadota bacterium]
MRLCFISVLALLTAGTVQATERDPIPPQSIECVAVFELMQRAAPSWSDQYTVQAARRSWHGIARDLAEQTEVNLVEQVQERMLELADLTALAPQRLSDKAMACIADAPA